MSSIRTESRGRDAIISTGRGGAGNAIRSPSRSKTSFLSDPTSSPLVPGSERGRSVHTPLDNQTKIHHTGRGGAGNTRSPSTQGRVQERLEEGLEERLVAERRGREAMAEVPFSTGRGGAGNINSSRSRSRSRQPSLGRTETNTSTLHPSGHNGQAQAAGGHHESALHHLFGGAKKSSATTDGELSKTSSRSSSWMTGGRGGYGNIVPVDEMSAEQKAQLQAEKEADAQILQRWRTGHPEGAHSAGRGGTGNLAPPLDPESTHLDLSSLSLEEREARDKVALDNERLGRTHGHGGLGNYHPPSVPRINEEDAGGRGRGGEREAGGGVMRKVLRSISRHSGSRDR